MFSTIYSKIRSTKLSLAKAALEERDCGKISDDGNQKPIKTSGGQTKAFALKQQLRLASGPLLFAAVMLIPTSAGFTGPMKAAAASTLWIAAWWITEAIPISATSLLPLLLFPAAGVISFDQTAAGYANSIVFLFMGGFMLAVTMQRWNLHRRLALRIIGFVGTNPARLILGFMVATGFLSMWISNTATAVMMMPVGLAVIVQIAGPATEQGLAAGKSSGNKFSFGTALMLGIAYSASIGGVATLIGSPPNAIFASVVSTIYGVDVSFTQWFVYGFPIAVIFLTVAWLYLIRSTSLSAMTQLTGAKEVIGKELQSLGPISRPEKLTAGVFLFTAAAWIFRSLFLQNILPFLSDSLIAVVAIFLLFTIPVDIKKGIYLLDWDTAVKIPWGILLLFGGGIAIANGFIETGLAEWIGQNLSVMQGAPLIVVLLVLVTLLILMTNVTSNTGTISMMLPVIAAMAPAMAVHPFGMMIAATTAVSFAFMLPAGTPPNAVVFGSGYVSIPEMAKAGLILTVIAGAVVPLIIYFWIPLSWGISLN